jgi:hypothetical protein
MAWPTPPNAGDLIEDTLMDAIIDALALWGGNVNAGGHNLTGVTTLGATSLNVTNVNSSAGAASFTTAAGSILLKPQNSGAGSGGGLQIEDPTGGAFWIVDNFTQVFRIFHSSGLPVLALTVSGGVAINQLPSANPGAGTKQLWYDPADSNRVKYAA